LITRSDKVRIIEAITCDGHVKGLREDVMENDSSREEVHAFLIECFETLLTEKCKKSGHRGCMEFLAIDRVTGEGTVIARGEAGSDYA
jgi:ArsR family metal-binding transcriptional regulator